MEFESNNIEDIPSSPPQIDQGPGTSTSPTDQADKMEPLPGGFFLNSATYPSPITGNMEQAPGNSTETEPTSYVPTPRLVEYSSDEDEDVTEMLEAREVTTERLKVMKYLGFVGFTALNQATAKPRTVIHNSEEEIASKVGKGKKCSARRKPAKKSDSNVVPPDNGASESKLGRKNRKVSKTNKRKRRATKSTALGNCHEILVDISGDTDDGESSIELPKTRVLPERGCKKKVAGSGCYVFADELCTPQPSKKAKPKSYDLVEEDWLARTVRGIAINSRRNYIFRIQYMKEGETKWVRLSKVWGCIDLIVQYVIKDGRKWVYCIHKNLVPDTNRGWTTEDRSDGMSCDKSCTTATNAPWYVEGEDARSRESDDTRNLQEAFLDLLELPSEDEDRFPDFQIQIWNIFLNRPIPTNHIEPHRNPKESFILSSSSTSQCTPTQYPGRHVDPLGSTKSVTLPRQIICPTPIDLESNPCPPIGSNDSTSTTAQGTQSNPLFVRPRGQTTSTYSESQTNDLGFENPDHPVPKPPHPLNSNGPDPLERPIPHAHAELSAGPSLLLINPCFGLPDDSAVPIKVKLEPLASTADTSRSWRPSSGHHMQPNNPHQTGKSMVTKRLPLTTGLPPFGSQSSPCHKCVKPPTTPIPLFSIRGLEAVIEKYRQHQPPPQPNPQRLRSDSKLNPDGSPRFCCPICGLSFESQNRLKNHRRRKHGNKH